MRIKTAILQMLTKVAAARTLLPFTPPPPVISSNNTALLDLPSPLLLKLILIALALLAALPVHAATITVNSSCSLANAVAAAHTDTVRGGCPAGSGDDTIVLTGNLTITTVIEIPSSAAAHNTAIDGKGFTITGGSNRFLDLAKGTLTVNNLRITNFKSGENGGAIAVAAATLHINDSHFYGNSGNSGGVLYTSSSPTVHIKRSAFYNNSGSRDGGVISATGTMTITNSSFFNNTAGHMGGAILITGSANSVTMNQVTMFNNTAKNNRWSLPGGAGGGIVDSKGGAAVALRHSIVYGNNPNDCTRDADGGTSVMGTNVNNFIGASHCGAGSGNSNANPDLAGPGVHGLGNFYIPRANSPVINKSGVSCLASTIAGYNEDQRKISRPVGSTCDIGAIEHAGYTPPPPTQIPAPPPGSDFGGPGGGSSGSASRSGSSAELAMPAAVPVIRYSPEQSCQTLQPDIVVSKASSGTSCSRVEGSEIGHPDVIAANPSLVVDLWGWVTPGTQVCFLADSGSIKFIDTTAIPRTVADLPVFSEAGGLLCATIDGAGQVALVAGPSAPAPQQQAASAQGRSLSGCMVTLQYSLNFRDAPDGEKIGALRSQIELTALERTDGWFKVDYYGEQGWIAAAYVEPEGDCV